MAARKHVLLFSLLLSFVSVVSAQNFFTLPVQNPPTNFDQHEAFNPLFYPSYGDDVRAADGTPGPKYWQNRADYVIDASLDDSLQSITGTVTITYTNNSPQNLQFVWLFLDQNIYSL